MNPGERFLSKCEPDGNGCLVWKGVTSTEGYGRFRFDGRYWQAHRWILDRLWPHGIPAHLDVDHLCRNRRCVLPSHLEVVTRSVNIKRGLAPAILRARAALITHCPQGHAYDAANTYIHVKANGARCRQCKRCATTRTAATQEMIKVARQSGGTVYRDLARKYGCKTRVRGEIVRSARRGGPIHVVFRSPA